MQAPFPERTRVLNNAAPPAHARFILYWTQMNRRADSNHALAVAAHIANRNQLPLLVYEGLTHRYPHANDRLHRFLLEGVPETQAAVQKLRAGYFFYLHRSKQDPDDVLYRLASDALCVVTDDYPVFIAARHNATVPRNLKIPYIAVDSSCIVPMSRHEKRSYGAYTIRPKMHRELPLWLHSVDTPHAEKRWSDELLSPEMQALRTEVSEGNIDSLVAECDIDHAVRPSLSFSGGTANARKHLEHFLKDGLKRYANEAGQPSKHATSDLSPYLHFGHISALEIALAVKQPAAEFLEELIVRRELAFNFARYTENPETLEVLPNWCLRTMAAHAGDKREFVYTREQFERAETHDALWNATQKEMLLRGKIHGYYRMYWGKKIIEWSPTYEEALATMIHIHDVWALDGRDPNTYTNILWCFGLHDRPWGERPVFGQLRYMSLEGMKRKTNVDEYIKEIAYMEHTGKDPFRL
jgi:deoxyribodipyrimidine photo-lyase